MDTPCSSFVNLCPRLCIDQNSGLSLPQFPDVPRLYRYITIMDVIHGFFCPFGFRYLNSSLRYSILSNFYTSSSFAIYLKDDAVAPSLHMPGKIAVPLSQSISTSSSPPTVTRLDVVGTPPTNHLPASPPLSSLVKRN